MKKPVKRIGAFELHPMQGFIVVVSCGHTMDAVIKWIEKKYGQSDPLKKYSNKDGDTHCSGTCIEWSDPPFCGCLYVVWYRNADVQMHTIIHELTHLVDFTLQRIGANNEMEFRAYLTDFAYRQTIDTLQKPKEKSA